MRLLSLLTVVLVTVPALGMAQDRPLYNSRSIHGAPTGAAPLYNSGQTGGQPLSLNQITQGKNNAGYSYERDGTGFRPFNSSDYSGSTQAAAEAYRADRAAQAANAEQQAMNSLMGVHQDSINNHPIFNNVTGAAAGTNVYAAPEKKKQKYDGRDRGINEPPKVFNSVR